MRIQGFVIQNEEGEFLSKELCWCEYPRREDAWVHPQENLGEILWKALFWDFKPTRLWTAARFTDTGNTKVGKNPLLIKWS